jgi:hypothetical protein
VWTIVLPSAGFPTAGNELERIFDIGGRVDAAPPFVKLKRYERLILHDEHGAPQQMANASHDTTAPRGGTLPSFLFTFHLVKESEPTIDAAVFVLIAFVIIGAGSVKIDLPLSSLAVVFATFVSFCT